jgi:phenylalanyl-tRNA synthetase beta chain
MRVPLRWLREYVDLPAEESPRAIADRLTSVGLEVETVEDVDVVGPLVVGRVLEALDEPQSNGKTIRWCQVDVGAHNAEGGSRGIVCGAHNFAVGDHVVVALPGAVLPGGFTIAARTTYGHVSDGMICSLKELDLGDDHTGIYVLTPTDLGTAQPGDDAKPLLGLPETVLDIAVTPDRGYALSIRGVARELGTAYGVPFRDPAAVEIPTDLRDGGEGPGAGGHPVLIGDPTGADRIVLRRVTGFDPTTRSPLWLTSRLHQCGMRPISLAVDVTNYVMLELGQPLHAFDRTLLQGEVVLRRAHAGERLTTLDGADRVLDREDLLVTDASGPIALAGTMGGTSTEITPTSTELVLEAAHFDAVTVARQSRRHKLSSEASRRFERGVDPALPPYATARAANLLVQLGGARHVGFHEVDLRPQPSRVSVDVRHPGRVAGIDYAEDVVLRRLADVGCEVAGPDSDHVLTVTPPPWRPDLTDPNDLAEEVIRLEGYGQVPSRLRPTPAGVGVTPGKRHGLLASRRVAAVGLTEVRCHPFVGEAALDALGLPPDDPRRTMVRLANPLSDEEPCLRTTLLPGLLATVKRNLGRGFSDLAVFENGRVFLPKPGHPLPMPRLGVDHRPSEEELAALDAALPDQPFHLAAVLTGQVEADGWWGAGRPATWADAIQVAREAAHAIDAPLVVRAARREPWHPGRCAELLVDTGEALESIGYAGELHPRAIAALGLPARTVAVELDLTALAAYAEDLDVGPAMSGFPLAKEDVAVVVDEEVTAAAVEDALRAGAGDLLESLRLFDVYRDERLGAGRKSLAYALRFRASDRTLTVEEASAAKDAAVAEAARRVGAIQRT